MFVIAKALNICIYPILYMRAFVSPGCMYYILSETYCYYILSTLFPDEPGKQVRSAIRLKNTSRSHVAFKVK